ncbi:MAG: bifunctional glutamate N-acetyltransferase/amino-acid acetyltransferase ArgJ [Lachnospiraceae bacterium]|nr:bifunctional glutamate N-acetyltransferase/amino-acid acetyltransferase ArgJ [Lachnospiraceae bacterium]
MKKIEGGVTAAQGFEAASAAARIKYEGRTDMALIFSKAPCECAGTFTTNVVKAAPVIWDREMVYSGAAAHAVIVNSGIANACTGKEGMDYCRQTAEEAAACLGISADSVLVGSTGVIGFQLPIDRIKAGVRMLAENKKAGLAAGTEAAKAIMTTDTVHKEVAYEFEVGGKKAVIGGMAKGSGMIHPNMCTMLGYVTTDAAIEKKLLQKALSEIVQETFNMISVDGDTSTNDTLLVLANGLAGNAPVSDEKSEDYAVFYQALKTVCRELAMKMAGDGEGCTRLIETRVIHADTLENARILAKSVITSSLTKAAVFGKDANWGRILCALGYSGAQFDPENCDLYFGEGEDRILIFTDGSAADYSEEKATELLSGEKVVITADMHMGEAEATAWGCDLTYDYVKINADYRS